ncbi:Solute carrier family 2, facilitated glucose transporter member 6 [Bagarius yarrelli]|uniref:Solute carrier family 2, facilitated glucose transporter member 6 n=1 Tax=Bagarius yarrelli TaxID=175774 RepID=A0A556UFP4_BAGYA|nr:Solute carrier family 2, facilitated glucose transporter member 6 [Bagarius yarrelli]
MVFPSAVIEQLQKEEDPALHLDVHQISWFGSVFSIGVMVGGLSAMVLIDKIGRKHSIMISVIPSMAGFLILAVAHKVCLLLLGRLFTGIAAGIQASSIPVGLILPWRWLAIAGEVPVLIMLILLCFMPNSPRYLITNNKREEAARALKWLRGSESNYIAELNQIEQTVNSQPPKFDAAIVALVRLFSVATAAALIDKVGRKALLYISAFIMYLATLSMTIYTLKTSCDTGNTTAETYGTMAGSALSSSTLIPLISIVLFIFGYAIGWGPITWLLMSEILPTAARGVASGLCVVVSWATAFALTQVFMHAVEAYGLFTPFLLFCVICVLNIIFTAKCVPETKGRSLEEIENYFRTGRTFTIAES